MVCIPRLETETLFMPRLLLDLVKPSFPYIRQGNEDIDAKCNDRYDYGCRENDSDQDRY